MDEINEFAKQFGYDYGHFLKKWNGYDVYKLKRNNQDPKGFYGWGTLVLVKGDVIRKATLDEMYQFAMSK